LKHYNGVLFGVHWYSKSVLHVTSHRPGRSNFFLK
jgi:hypothetical protein